MKRIPIKTNSFKYKLIFSYLVIVLVSLLLAAHLLEKNLEGKSLLTGIALALAMAFIAGSLMAKSLMKPLDKIIHASRRFSAGDFAHKILLGPAGQIGELARALNDMAARLDAKIREVQVQNQHLKAILETMVEGIIVTDNAGRIISVNPTVERIFGVTAPEAQGKGLLEAIRNNEIADILDDVLKNGRFISREISLSWPAQKIFKVDASPVLDVSGARGCLLVIHDITEIRGLETMRRDFVANVSHELKTPLTSIKGFVETLLEGALEDKENSRHFLQIIHDHANRLDSLISDLLDLSSFESQRASLVREDFGLKGLTDDILSGFNSQLKKKSVSAVNDLPASLSLAADKDKIRQVLVNLIDNAIKFNRQGGTLKIYSQDAGEKIKVIVEDSGNGIPAKDIPRIFERFYRVDKARSRELGGTGLGLSIVKHIIESHGGSVGVESTEGLGSKFWFTLPK